MTTAILINVQAPGGYQPGAGVLVVDPSQAVPGPGGRLVLTVGQAFEQLDLSLLVPRGATYAQAITIATDSSPGPAFMFGLEVIDVGGQIDLVPTPAPGDGLNEQGWFNVYVAEGGALRFTNADTFATPAPCVVTIDAYAITADSRSRIQCCYNGSPALIPLVPEPPPAIDAISPSTVQVTDPAGVAIVSGSNFQPGDEVLLMFGLFVVPLVTTFVGPDTVNVDYDPATITPNIYTLTLRRSGVSYFSAVTFTVQAA
jgi:hypothetical protein